MELLLIPFPKIEHVQSMVKLGEAIAKRGAGLGIHVLVSDSSREMVKSEVRDVWITSVGEAGDLGDLKAKVTSYMAANFADRNNRHIIADVCLQWEGFGQGCYWPLSASYLCYARQFSNVLLHAPGPADDAVMHMLTGFEDLRWKDVARTTDPITPTPPVACLKDGAIAEEAWLRRYGNYVLVNSTTELEPQAIADDVRVRSGIPTYFVGPNVEIEPPFPPTPKHLKIGRWLHEKASRSVVYVPAGGRYTHDLVVELGAVMEFTHRFMIWRGRGVICWVLGGENNDYEIDGLPGSS